MHAPLAASCQRGCRLPSPAAQTGRTASTCRCRLGPVVGLLEWGWAGVGVRARVGRAASVDVADDVAHTGRTQINPTAPWLSRGGCPQLPLPGQPHLTRGPRRAAPRAGHSPWSPCKHPRHCRDPPLPLHPQPSPSVADRCRAWLVGASCSAGSSRASAATGRPGPTCLGRCCTSCTGPFIWLRGRASRQAGRSVTADTMVVCVCVCERERVWWRAGAHPPASKQRQVGEHVPPANAAARGSFPHFPAPNPCPWAPTQAHRLSQQATGVPAWLVSR